MIVVAYIIFSFGALRLMVSFINLAFREKPRRGTLYDKPLVSVLIPARNEESNIGTLLGDLDEQLYENVEILVFDDMSEDDTAKVVLSHSERDKRIRLIRSEGLPEGWTGKNYACHCLAKEAGGRWLLFLDADVRISGSIIPDMISFANRHRLALISIFPKQIMISTGEKISVPVMNYILLSLLPLVFVRKVMRFPSLSAANGQFMFYDTEIYRRVQPHEKLRNKRVEDIAGARMLKRMRYRIACLTGDDSIKCRMYRDFREAAEGFSKNIIAYFGNSFFAAILFWFVTTFGFIPVFIYLQLWQALAYIGIGLLIRVFVSAASGQNIAQNLFYAIPQQMAAGFFIIKAIINSLKGGYEWKGRSVR